MLDLAKVDLSSLCEALEDHSPDHGRWLDPGTGAVEIWSSEIAAELDEEHPEEQGWIAIEPIESHEAYEDLADFASRVRDPRAREMLERAIAGRGAFRRFKDALFEFPELRQRWFEFHDRRMERRALEWLEDQGLVDAAEVARGIDARPDPSPPELSGPWDAREIAAEVAAGLRELYGERLRRVLLFGSWARGDAHPESDIDLLVVLAEMESPWEELRAMDDVLWQASLANDTVVTALPVSEEALSGPVTPAVMRARDEGVAVG